ncbi:hypothetical protein [Actinacidiphila acidipaludis]|uniref:Esterase n=1 Tax=Actinacidiphila acidipaludis TaxID=2873382 RepID=A0ABS7Q9H2_9ACTN|nr:hypothetical protein [Streptomyces acidipaludis]MBY8879762.1 hypothetical protein [Streptomyces acidipaludis]
MADAVLTVMLLAAAAATAVLAFRTLRYWRGEQAGRVYELPVDRRGTVLRAGAATTCAALVAMLAVTMWHTEPTGHTRTAAATTRATTAAPVVPPPPPPPPRTPHPAPPPPEVRTVAHPAGGTLEVLRDGTQVWLPPLYDAKRSAGIAYPVVVVHTTDPVDLFKGFAVGAQQHKADLFVLVIPPGCAPAPGAQGPTPATVLDEVASRYRTLTATTARGILGIGPQASCAVQEALANAGRYGAAAGVSGSYATAAALPGNATAAGTGSAAHPALLLATGPGESGPRTSGHQLRTTLHARGVSVRTLDGLAPRRQLFETVAAYFTEKLDGPSRISHPRT